MFLRYQKRKFIPLEIKNALYNYKKKCTKNRLERFPSLTGFTLIELLIVVGIIAILAAAVVVVINPGRQFASARDATRESHINSLYTSLISYQVSHQGGWDEIGMPQELTEICNTNLNNPDCEDLVNLSTLVPDYINQIPVDPQGSVSAVQDGTGYFISESSIILVAENWETRFLGVGMTEDQYAEYVENFSCDEYEGVIVFYGDPVYCDMSGNIWTPTLDLTADGGNYQDYDWSSAIDQCENLDYGGKDDWGLPGLSDLEELYDGAGSEPSYDINARSAGYWSSMSDMMGGAWMVDFSNGESSVDDVSEHNFIRCVLEEGISI